MRRELLDKILDLLPAGGETPELAQYAAMLRDYPQRGGKGIRSELLLATARAYGAQPGQAAWEQALWLAAALELFQNWVLIHDDIEDGSEERRGQPALHRLYSVPLAINAGDALHVFMWKALLQAQRPEALHEFVEMVLKTAEGQHLDLSWVEGHTWNLTEQDYLRMVRLKTAYYTVIYPLRLGMLAAGHEPHPALTEAGLALGTAFQIRDDVLNLIGDPDKYGKEIGGDLLEGKRTLILLHWLRRASDEQRQVFMELMGQQRARKDSAQVAQVLAWLGESGSIGYAQAFADAQASEGLSLLSRALQDAPDRDATNALLDSMKRLASRDS